MAWKSISNGLNRQECEKVSRALFERRFRYKVAFVHEIWFACVWAWALMQWSPTKPIVSVTYTIMLLNLFSPLIELVVLFIVQTPLFKFWPEAMSYRCVLIHYFRNKLKTLMLPPLECIFHSKRINCELLIFVWFVRRIMNVEFCCCQESKDLKWYLITFLQGCY